MQLVDKPLSEKVAGGEIDERQTIYREIKPTGFGSNRGGGPTPKLVLAGDSVAYVVSERDLYRWEIPGVGKKSEAAADNRLKFTPKQSILMFSGLSGKQVLKHQTTGGKAPLKFEIVTPYDGIAVDAATGDVTIDEEAMVGEASQKFEELFTKSSRAASLVDGLRELTATLATKVEPIVGRKPKGVPVGIPVRIEVTDADGSSDSLQYFVIADISTAAMTTRLKQIDEERRKGATTATRPSEPATRPAIGGKDDSTADVAVLRKRIEALEDRLDLVTRQLNEILKKLDK